MGNLTWSMSFANDSALCGCRQNTGLAITLPYNAQIYFEQSLLERVYKITNSLCHWWNDAIPCGCDWNLLILYLQCTNEGQICKAHQCVACKMWESLMPNAWHLGVHTQRKKLAYESSLALRSTLQMLWDGGCSQHAGAPDAIPTERKERWGLVPGPTHQPHAYDDVPYPVLLLSSPQRNHSTSSDITQVRSPLHVSMLNKIKV